ncbi:hypothetical protein NMG60_11000418 [Bertholletia excelsa]
MEIERHDLISTLPSEILRQIVSFIPLKEAVRTSTLSTTWRSLWTPFEVDLDSEKPIQATCKHLTSSELPRLWKFRLLKNNLFFLAAKGLQQELLLDFSGGIKQKPEKLDLAMETSCLSPSKPSKQAAFAFSSLRTLHLRSLNSLAKDLISELFSNLQLLESLKLEKCIGLRSIEVKASTFLRSFFMVGCPEVASITISAPNLKSFKYRGVLPLVRFENSPSLVDVELDLREGLGQGEFDCEDVLSLLGSFQNIETLSISSWLLEWLCRAGVIFGQLNFQLNKLKDLHWTGPVMNQFQRDSLACFLNIMPCLEKLCVEVDESYSSFPSPFFHQYWHEPHLWMDYETVKSDTAQLNHLRAVKLVGFSGKEDELLLMDLLLKKAFDIKSMTITSPRNRSWSVTKIPLTQLKQTIRCYPEQIGVSFPNKDYFFGLRKSEKCFCTSNGSGTLLMELPL